MRNVLGSIQTPADHLQNSELPKGQPCHIPLSASQGPHHCPPIPDPIPGSSFISLESLCDGLKGSWLRAGSSLPPKSADLMQDALPWPSFSPFPPRETNHLRASHWLVRWRDGHVPFCGESQSSEADHGGSHPFPVSGPWAETSCRGFRTMTVTFSSLSQNWTC